MSENLPDKTPDADPLEALSHISEVSGEIDLSAYIGRWIAVADNQIAGVGDTAISAERLGRRNRLRERLAVYYVEPPGDKPLALPRLLEEIRPVLAHMEEPLFLVGGTVRDVLLGHSSHDLDFVVPRNAIQQAFRVGNKLGAPAYVLDSERDAGRVMVSDHGTTLDFTSYRGPDLEADLRKRDFTVNAMALPFAANRQASLIDPCGGLADLEARLIRLNYPEAIDDDPVRSLRAIRLVVAFDFSPTPETVLAASRAAPQLDRVSTERVRDELIKAIATDHPDLVLNYLHSWQILPVVLPEISRLDGLEQSPPHHEAVLNHSATTLKHLSEIESCIVGDAPTTNQSGWAAPYLDEAREVLAPYQKSLQAHLERQVTGGLDGRILLRLAALFHDVGKAETYRVDTEGQIHFYGHDHIGARITGDALTRLRLSRQAIAHVKTCVAGHMRPLLLAKDGAVSRRAIYRFFRATQNAGLDIGLIGLADYLATSGGLHPGHTWNHLVNVIKLLFEYYFDQYEESVRPAPLLGGNELISELQIDPGPEIGRLLQLIAEAQAAGEINSIDEAMALAQEEIKKT